ncbi:hypothetical protein [Burkholderia vietnamiensis]|uniref:Uncharacterized protein n=1 Tax=Burkholderia vietnamiensis TaxID=60552 RepID=A0ABS1ARU4_BURVI|nr:hypothetical protein [Burkholderia vietnamiensis]MBJ9686873.1 hypothetical protein [Burkholderia vietnamiensis]MBR8000519.1 hypothetical protein [Burkholderia vietnamiensis]MBR8189513.1 hypothetical protein [Burkholderia vietnamiensis]MBR8218477.1 hypothetical protein [Burkholderia vietnamiensis]MCA8267374.1 hypothetical protein [Burkholderia vietnamiensis]
MSADCKKSSIRLLLVIVIATSAVNAIAEVKYDTVECGPGDECTTTITNEAKNLCPNAPLQISWNKNSSWTLVSCSCNCSEQDNKNWFVARNGSVIGLEIGRRFPRSFFSENLSPMVPDIMASHSMCKPADKKMIDQSTFILLDKQPSAGEKDPYCYDTIYVVERDGSINFIEDGKKVNNRSYFSGLSESDKNSLTTIAKRTLPSWKAAADHESNNYFLVVSERAYLYDRPLPQAAGKAYLIAGDKVETLGSPHDGYIKFRYIAKNGKIIEKWVKCIDINYPDNKIRP